MDLTTMRAQSTRLRSVVLPLVIVALPMVALLRYEAWVDRTAKQELLRFRGELRVGASRAEVIERFHRGAYHRLRLVDLRDEMTVQTPFRLTVLNWDLWLTFEQDTLTGVQVRDSDGRNSIPSKAPPDIVNR